MKSSEIGINAYDVPRRKKFGLASPPEKVRVCAAVAAGDRRHSAPARRIAQAQ